MQIGVSFCYIAVLHWKWPKPSMTKKVPTNQPTSNPHGTMNTKTKLSALVSSIALIGILTLPAHASLLEKTKQEPVATSTPVEDTPEPTPEPSPEVTPEEKAELAYEKPEVLTEPALVEVQEAPEPEPAPVLPANTPAVAPVAPKVAPAAPTPTPAPAAPAQAPVVASSGKAAVATAALGQIGVMQDCTRLVTNSLRAVGINFHGWPHEYFSLGTQISAAEAQPGDLIYYQYGSAPGSLAHIAVYIGNGQAVHGGWNGNETRIFSAQVGSGPVFIRLR